MLSSGASGIAQLVGQHRQELVLGGVGLAQPLLQALLIVDVRASAEPALDPAGLVAHRQGAAQVPAVAARSAVLEAVLDLVRIAGPHGFVPGIHAPKHVVGMEDGQPALVAVSLLGETGVFVPAAIEIIETAVGLCGPDDLRHGVGQGAVAAFALAQLLLGLLLTRNVPEDDHQTCQAAVGDDGGGAARHGETQFRPCERRNPDGSAARRRRLSPAGWRIPPPGRARRRGGGNGCGRGSGVPAAPPPSNQAAVPQPGSCRSAGPQRRGRRDPRPCWP